MYFLSRLLYYYVVLIPYLTYYIFNIKGKVLYGGITDPMKSPSSHDDL